MLCRAHAVFIIKTAPPWYVCSPICFIAVVTLCDIGLATVPASVHSKGILVWTVLGAGGKSHCGVGFAGRVLAWDKVESVNNLAIVSCVIDRERTAVFSLARSKRGLWRALSFKKMEYGI